MLLLPPSLPKQQLPTQLRIREVLRGPIRNYPANKTDDKYSFLLIKEEASREDHTRKYGRRYTRNKYNDSAPLTLAWAPPNSSTWALSCVTYLLVTMRTLPNLLFRLAMKTSSAQATKATIKTQDSVQVGELGVPRPSTF